MEIIRWCLMHLYNFLTGTLFALIGYFSPVKGVMHVMVASIIIDLVIGITAARHRGEGIESRKLWRTAYKLFISIVIVTLSFSLDTEVGVFQIHKIIAWLITGFELWSILESAGKMTQHPLFMMLQKFMEKKVKETTGIDLDVNNDENEQTK